MLQQTRVETAKPYFDRWMRRFPTVADLAEASEEMVLRWWEGLGYYSRARRLRSAALTVIRVHDGRLPTTVAELRALPGIGDYTAAAIASIAFGANEASVDGNVRRVLARLFDVAQPIDRPAGMRLIKNLAVAHLPAGRAGEYNQALMDIGATICLPATPRCPVCPLANLCGARIAGTINVRPVRRSRRKIANFVHAAAVISRNGRTLLAKRHADGLLGGLWEFPQGRVSGSGRSGFARLLRRDYGILTRSRSRLATIKHAYTHFRVTVHAYECELLAETANSRLRWTRFSELENLPMGKVDRQISRLLPR